MAATSSRTITIAISAIRARILRRWQRSRRIARSISARSRNRSARDCGSATWSSRALADAVRSEKCLLNNGNPWLEQATLADFMHNGSYAAHLLRVRSHYKENRDCLIAALRRNFGDVLVDGDSGGLHVLWHLPPGIPDAVDGRGVALRARIGVYSLSSARRAFPAPDRADEPRHHSRLRGVVAKADRKRHRAAFGRDRRRHRRSRNRHDRVVPDQFAAAPRPRPASCRIWLHDFGNNRLYAARASSCNLAPDHRHKVAAANAGLKNIYRYPIKGLSAQRFPRVDLQAGKPFPHDRIFALVRPGAPIDTSAEMGQEGPVRHADARGGVWRGSGRISMSRRCSLTIAQDGTSLLVDGGSRRRGARARSRNSSGSWCRHCAARRRWFVRADGHFMDKPDNVISLINLATVRSLEEQWGYRDRSAAVSRQPLHRRRASRGKSSNGSAATSGSAARPFRSIGATAGAARPTSIRDRTSRPRYAGLVTGRVRPQGIRGLPHRPGRRTLHGRRPGVVPRAAPPAGARPRFWRPPPAQRSSCAAGVISSTSRPRVCPISRFLLARLSRQSRRTGDVPIAEPKRRLSARMSSPKSFPAAM